MPAAELVHEERRKRILENREKRLKQIQNARMAEQEVTTECGSSLNRVPSSEKLDDLSSSSSSESDSSSYEDIEEEEERPRKKFCNSLDTKKPIRRNASFAGLYLLAYLALGVIVRLAFSSDYVALFFSYSALVPFFILFAFHLHKEYLFKPDNLVFEVQEDFFMKYISRLNLSHQIRLYFLTSYKTFWDGFTYMTIYIFSFIITSYVVDWTTYILLAFGFL